MLCFSYTLFLGLILFPPLSQAAATEWKINPEGQVRLIAAQNVVSKTGTLLLGLHFKTTPGWYVYWKVAGDAGYPPKVQWQGSEGFHSPEFLWPAPTKFILPGNIIE
jgi:suppressor for copper-sensitivity B